MTGGHREYLARVGGRERSVRVEPDGDGLRIRIDGEEFHVTCEAYPDGEHCLLMNGRPQVAIVRAAGAGRYRVIHGAGEVTVELADAIESRLARRAGSIRQEGEIEIRSPMHGTVIAVQAAEGDLVEEEAPLVVLEAMKMQNALTSPARGRVVRVLVRPGQAVEGEALLAVLEREEGGGQG